MAKSQPFSLEGAQEIDDFLLLLHFELVEVVDDPIGLAAFTFVRPDGLNEIHE